MKKRILMLFALMLLLATVIPVQVYAFGGFVAPYGSDTYHQIYCIYVEGYHINELRWYDTAKQAEAAGLKSCYECDASNGFDFSYDLETYWKTDNHLIQSALEIEGEAAYWDGHAEGYAEGYSEAENNYEFSISQAIDVGYDEGFQNGEDYGYDKGYDAAAEHYQTKIESLNENHEKEIKEARERTPWGWIIPTAVIVYCLGVYLTANKKETEIRKLKDQHEAMKVVEIIAAESGTTPSELLDRVYINYRAIDGVPEETAKAELRNKKLNKNSQP